MAKKKSYPQLLHNVIGNFIEEAGADAVVMIFSTVKRGQTHTYLIPYGNAHTCNALIDYAYENFNPPTTDELEDVEDE